MTEEEMIKIMKKAVDKYGEKQLDIAQEELAELIQAISKYKRASTPDEIAKARNNIIEELADVCIMVKQIYFLLDFNRDDLITNMMKYKLRRLDQRMENDD
ncbi:MazG nucleotide pyrophosphohydrolase domain-containing protein [Clostridium thermobutyricum]|uniref:MazG nucleotide pyrophosphohydrolase domain-containing protein n=1 Tax=Clostridium thermobutyricum TaxID=29372 RepID=UPI001A9C16F2|nr:MazG nucleotide pyrophosphohydrolase domain-containing protein [Clostridium thermobutyricum]